ncbi:MAG: helix-turn-helix domain-containing protein [Pseudomonadota bacterium]
MFEKLCDNLNLLMAEIPINADELARRTGVPASTIKKIRNRYNPNPTLTTLLPLAEFFCVTLGQLAGNEPLPPARTKGQHLPSKTLQQIPLLSWEEAGAWPAQGIQPAHWLATEFHYSHNAFALLVEEDDLENLSRGTALFVDPALRPEHRDFIIVHKEGQKLPTLKQILFDEGQMYLKPLIQGYNIAALTMDHNIIGVVTEFKKHLRQPLPGDIKES